MPRSITGLLALSISWIFVVSAPLEAQAAQQSEPPPQHQVVQGNTLWDLAEQFYGNPFEWRRIWDANRERVDNPDLIYPGQVLLVPDGEGGMMEVVVMPGGGEEEPVEGEPQPQMPERTIWYPDTVSNNGFEFARLTVPAVQPEIVYGAPFLVGEVNPDPSLGQVGGLAGSIEVRSTRESTRTGDRIFVDFEGSAPAPGTLVQVWRRTEFTVEGLGTVAIPTGLIRIVGRDGERSVAVVDRIYDRMLRGDQLRPLPEYDPRPGVEPARVMDGPRVNVAGFALQTAEIHGPGDYLFIPRGSSDGVMIGDEYSVRVAGTGDMPEGRFQVVHLGEEYATGRIMTVRTPVFESGVEVMLERRMPGR